MIFIMALLGAVTRLTESGLSITDWAPVTGILPPLSKTAWAKAFAAYRQIPQYQLLHRDMVLSEFKNIYFWEWLHRLWGRLIGAVFVLPLIWFAWRRKISKALGLKLLVLFALGALQGFIGWYMVMSGLSLRTSVSPYRLALHLGFALLIYTLLLWTALDLSGTKRLPASWCLRRHGWASLALLTITMIWGAFTAGLHAGEAFNTWPLMEGEFLPSAALTILPHWHNVFENLAFVQFIHRWLGPTTALVILSWVWRLWNAGTDRRWVLALGATAFAQVALGITTLLMHAEITIAVTHQAGAIMLLSLMVVNLQRLMPHAG
jgi:cytochrome c oxidase assembly protein subunit 15